MFVSIATFGVILVKMKWTSIICLKKKKKETMFKISLRKTSEPVTITATINFASFQLEVRIAAETGNVEELSIIS